MGNLTNYHSHCSYCDGKAPVEEFIKAAVRRGFTSYGVSTHAPVPFETHWAIRFGDVGNYLQDLSYLKQKYQPDIELYAGMEIDYLDEKHNPSSAYFQDLPLDYRIGSVHLLHSDNGEVVDIDSNPETFRKNVDFYFNGDLERVVRMYYDKLKIMIGTGGFDFVGHADKISYNISFCRDGILNESWYKTLTGGYFEYIARSGVMIEVNTKAYERSGMFFPNRSHFNLLKDLHIPVIVNSDAHFPAMINDGRTEALRALKDAGIRSVYQLESGAWREVEIIV